MVDFIDSLDRYLRRDYQNIVINPSFGSGLIRFSANINVSEPVYVNNVIDILPTYGYTLKPASYISKWFLDGTSGSSDYTKDKLKELFIDAL